MSPAFQSTAVRVVFTGAPAAALVAVAGGPGGKIFGEQAAVVFTNGHDEPCADGTSAEKVIADVDILGMCSEAERQVADHCGNRGSIPCNSEVCMKVPNVQGVGQSHNAHRPQDCDENLGVTLLV